ncbi:hypothetical protein B0I37DRAFT_107103 [Chaetomium sp. MPI-CAGE-AT-0009]|nr:hypothetical protein B0I37DRAFT_107103 [Chaetomium sp. MPI-CAGE-AT-0009]
MGPSSSPLTWKTGGGRDQQQFGDKCWKEGGKKLRHYRQTRGWKGRDPSATIIAPSVLSCFHVSVLPTNRFDSGNLHRGGLAERSPVKCHCPDFAPWRLPVPLGNTKTLPHKRRDQTLNAPQCSRNQPKSVKSAQRGCAVLRVYDRSSHPHRQLSWNALRRMRVHPVTPTPRPPNRSKILRLHLLGSELPLSPATCRQLGSCAAQNPAQNPVRLACELVSSLLAACPHSHTPGDCHVDAGVELGGELRSARAGHLPSTQDRIPASAFDQRSWFGPMISV